MNVFSAVIMVVLAVAGMAAIVRELSWLLFCRRDDHTVLLITPINKDEQNAELVLRSALAKQRRLWGRGCGSAVCLDAELDEATLKICKSLCKEFGCQSFITKEELINRLESR